MEFVVIKRGAFIVGGSAGLDRRTPSPGGSAFMSFGMHSPLTCTWKLPFW
jgi:hypothetical protein